MPHGHWRQVGLDLMGSLPTTSRGSKYIAAMTDNFPKQPEAIAIESKSAAVADITDAAFPLVCRHGAMETLM